jgi:serine/threonine protein kinase
MKFRTNYSHLAMPFFISGGVRNELRFLVFKRFEKDLDSFLKDLNRINEKGVLCLMRQLILTLEYIHSCGYAHGDLKGSNIMINSNRQGF